MLNHMIDVVPAPALRRDFAVWAVAQTPKVRTVSATEFAVPDGLFTELPEHLLIGSLVDGHPYVSPDDDGPELLGVATAEGFTPPLLPEREATPGEPLPPVPDEAYGPDSVPLDDAPADDDTTCPICERTFTTSRGRDTHQRQAHADTEVS